jgi:Domain of unknown function (DUF4833)
MMRHIGALALALTTPVGPVSGDREIPSAFLVSKTENRNQVHYAVRVDQACRPTTSAPIRPYWLMREKGPRVTEPLLEREQAAYCIQHQRVEGSAVRISIRSLPSRDIVIQTWQASDGQCLSAAVTTIAGGRARLFDVHVVIASLGLGIDSILLTGWRDDGTMVRERIKR